MSNNYKKHINQYQVNPHLQKAYQEFMKNGLHYQNNMDETNKAWNEWCQYNKSIEYIKDDSYASKPKGDKLIAAHYTDTYDHLEEVKTSIPGLHLVRFKDV